MDNKSQKSTDSILLATTKTFSYLTIIFSGILLTRYLSKYDLGTYQQIVLISSIIGPTASFGFSQAIYFFCSEKENRNNYILFILQLAFIALIILLSCLRLSWPKIIILFNNDQLYNLFYITCIFTGFSLFQEFEIPSLIVFHRIKIYFYYKIIFNIILLLMLSYVILNKEKFNHVLYFICINYLAYMIFFIVLFIKLQFEDRNEQTHLINYGKVVKYALPLTFSFLMATAGRRIDLFMIAHWFSVEEFALYSRGALEIPLFTVITISIFSASMPTFVQYFKQKNYAKMKEHWHYIAKTTSLIFFPIFVFFYYFAREFIPFLYGADYVESYIVFRIYLFLLLIQIVSWNALPRANNMPKVAFYETVIFVTSNIILNLVCYNIFGFIGPAIATIVSYFLASSFEAWFIMKILHIKRIRHLLPWKDLMKIMLISVGCLAPIIILYNFAPYKSYFLILYFGAYMIIYCCASYFKLDNQTKQKLISIKTFQYLYKKSSPVK